MKKKFLILVLLFLFSFIFVDVSKAATSIYGYTCPTSSACSGYGLCGKVYPSSFTFLYIGCPPVYCPGCSSGYTCINNTCQINCPTKSDCSSYCGNINVSSLGYPGCPDVNCGRCPTGQTCSNYTCVSACVPNCNCANSILNSQTCSDGCGGSCTGKCFYTYGTQERYYVCKNWYCNPYIRETELQNCPLGIQCPGVPPVCVPDCSCENNTYIGDTCIDPNCGKTCNGKKPLPLPVCVPVAWSPDPSAYCSNFSLTQTNNCDTRQVFGTKTCAPSYCDKTQSPKLTCKAGNVYGVYNWINYDNCSVNQCNYSPIPNSCGDYLVDNCNPGTYCYDGLGDKEYEYCQNGDIWHKFKKEEKGCSGSSCYITPGFCGYDLKKPCQAGYTCKVVGVDDAECVPTSATWTEI